MKLVESLKALDTKNRRIIEEPLYKIKYIDEKNTEDYQFRYANEYSITVTFGTTQFIAEDVIRQTKGRVIEEAVEHMKRAIVDEVYGEFIKDLLDLEFEMRGELNYQHSLSLKKLKEIIEKFYT